VWRFRAAATLESCRAFAELFEGLAVALHIIPQVLTSQLRDAHASAAAALAAATAKCLRERVPMNWQSVTKVSGGRVLVFFYPFSASRFSSSPPSPSSSNINFSNCQHRISNFLFFLSPFILLLSPSS